MNAHYDLFSDGKVQVYNSATYGDNEERGGGYAKAKCDEGTADCKVIFFGGLVKGNYWIVSTDYTSYALVYSCDRVWLTLGLLASETVWILSRTETLDPTTMEYIEEVMTEQLPTYDYEEWLIDTVQGGDCNYEGQLPDVAAE